MPNFWTGAPDPYWMAIAGRHLLGVCPGPDVTLAKRLCEIHALRPYMIDELRAQRGAGLHDNIVVRDLDDVDDPDGFWPLDWQFVANGWSAELSRGFWYRLEKIGW